MSKRKRIACNERMKITLAANEAQMKELLAGIGQPACDVVACPPGGDVAQLQGLLAGAPIEPGGEKV